MKTKKLSRLTKALLDTASDMRKAGLVSVSQHEKITARHLGSGEVAIVSAKPITHSEIRSLRRRANLSQAVFARCLNVTTGYVSQLERGSKKPTGAALALLNVIRRHGIDAVI